MVGIQLGLQRCRLNFCGGVNEWEAGERRWISPSWFSWGQGGQGFGFDLMFVLLVVGGGGGWVQSHACPAPKRDATDSHRHSAIQSAALRSAVVLKEVHSVDAPNRCTCINRFNDGTAEVQLTKGTE